MTLPHDNDIAAVVGQLGTNPNAHLASAVQPVGLKQYASIDRSTGVITEFDRDDQAREQAALDGTAAYRRQSTPPWDWEKLA